jgi:hypothetical protein
LLNRTVWLLYVIFRQTCSMEGDECPGELSWCSKLGRKITHVEPSVNNNWHELFRWPHLCNFKNNQKTVFSNQIMHLYHRSLVVWQRGHSKQWSSSVDQSPLKFSKQLKCYCRGKCFINECKEMDNVLSSLEQNMMYMC